jgi:hypothetical protein
MFSLFITLVWKALNSPAKRSQNKYTKLINEKLRELAEIKRTSKYLERHNSVTWERCYQIFHVHSGLKMDHSPSSQMVWRKWVDSQHYQKILALKEMTQENDSELYQH